MHMRRNIKSFEPDEDVARMLERATQKDGIKLTHLCNRALRQHLRNLGYARKKDLTEKNFAACNGVITPKSATHGH
jgi:hypothetical protein